MMWNFNSCEYFSLHKKKKTLHFWSPGDSSQVSRALWSIRLENYTVFLSDKNYLHHTRQHSITFRTNFIKLIYVLTLLNTVRLVCLAPSSGGFYNYYVWIYILWMRLNIMLAEFVKVATRCHPLRALTADIHNIGL